MQTNEFESLTFDRIVTRPVVLKLKRPIKARIGYFRTGDSCVGVADKKELTGYKVPKQVRFVDAPPMSTVGKILRRELRDVK